MLQLQLGKSAQETFSKVKEHGEELGKTETLKTVSKVLHVQYITLFTCSSFSSS